MSDDGSRLFVIGDDALEDGTAFARLVAYDSQTGEPVWDRTLADPKGRHLLPWRIDTAGDRVSYAAGRLKSVGPDADRTTSIVVATYDATGEGEGDLISSVAAPTYGALPAGIALNRDGSMAYVTQAADEPISRENVAYTVAFDTAAADVDWTRYLEGWTTAGGATSRTFPWYFHPIEVSPRGSVVLTTYADPTNGYSGGYVTFSMDPATGGTQWIQREGVTDGAYYGSGPTLSVNPVTGQVVVTGPIIVDGRLKVLTWSLSPEGAQEWISVSNELPNNAAVPVGESTSGVWPAVVHSPDGRHVFVAGNVWAAVVDPSSSPDIVVAAFDTAA
jgi:hypothetical protein